jgi:hypothetical protein
MGMQESPKNVCHICLVFNVVLFMSPEMMLMMTIVLVKNSIYQEFVSNPNGVHWDVKVGRYRIVGNNLI